MPSEDGKLLKCAPFNTPSEALNRAPSSYLPLSTFALPKGAEKHYQQQYADMYFLRLSQLKPAVEQVASTAWHNFSLAGDTARRVDRVLDVRQGELCWVVGTVYMEMSLKPNILDDISKEHWISAPPSRQKYFNAQEEGKGEEMMLEDESGRLRIIMGGLQKENQLVTGCVMASLGTEQLDGSFEVLDVRYADFPRQPERWESEEAQIAVKGGKVKQTRGQAGKVAIVSGMEISGEAADDASLDLLMEYLIGEAAGDEMQEESSRITRLIIAGGSLAHSSPIPSREEATAAKKGHKKHYGYDSSAYDAAPSERLDDFLSELLPTIPVTLMPGASDPASVAIPQQALHPALFPTVRQYAKTAAQAGEPLALDSVTNPWEGDIDGWRFLGTGGQTVADLLKYIEEDSVLNVMEAMLRWRCIAPTAPDTLWCYPFQDDDPLIVKDCPHIYFAGNQPSFDSRVAEGPAGQKVRIISVPKFRDSKTIVLLDMETLEVELVDFGVVQPR